MQSGMQRGDYRYSKQQVEMIAELIVEKLKEKGFHPPYTLNKLKELCDRLGIKVKELPLGYNFENYDREGKLVVSEDAYPFEGSIQILNLGHEEKVEIVLNTDRPLYNPRRTHFTLAHELGHYFLHYKLRGIHDIPKDTFYTFNRKSSYDQFEREANWFASAFLMPAKDVKKKWEEVKEKYKNAHPAFLKIHAITELSDYFKVSRLAMKYRLQELGIID